jgi:Flp pilus assembly protein TadB
MSMCPMADTCKGMMENPLSGLVMLVPGIAFIALGILIIAWPAVLVWLVAAACILVGCAMLLMANLMRRISSRFKEMHEHGSSTGDL